MMHSKILAMLVLAATAAATPAIAVAGEKRATAKSSDRVARDCTPINGRYGYYGNPWCDTGSHRQEDIQFRERHPRLRKSKDEVAK